MQYTTIKNNVLNRVKNVFSIFGGNNTNHTQNIQTGSDGGMDMEKITLIRHAPDIGGWRTAHIRAEDIYNPDRKDLYNIYRENCVDAHYLSVTSRIKMKCTNSRIKYLVDGEEDKKHPINAILKTPYFNNLIEEIIESKFWGHSLIQLNFLQKDFDIRKKQGIELVHRPNVRPEFGDFLLRPGDLTATIPYRELPYSNYLLEVGKPNDLGLMLAATPSLIYKRFGVKNWAEFLEVYGMPISEIQYDPNVPKAREAARLEAQNRGSNSTIIVPIGSKFQIHDSAKAGNSQAFELSANYHNREISKLFLLQTMTTEDGASLAQGKVHQQGEDEAIAAYRMFVEYTLNYYLRPILELHGYNMGDGELKYDDTEKYSLAQMADILIKLSAMLDIPQSYLRKLFNIPEPEGDDDVKRPQPSPTNTPNTDAQPLDNQAKKQENKPTEVPKNEKKKATLVDLLALQLPLLPQTVHECAATATLAFDDSEINDSEVELLRRIYEKQQQTGVIDLIYADQLAKQLYDAVQTGFGTGSIDYNTPDYRRLSMLEANVTRFSAAKSVAMVQQLNEFKNSSDTFDAFHQKAKTVLTDYNTNWLRTEYETAHAVGRNASAWIHNEANKDLYPYLRYETVGDERVRAAHAALNGRKFKIGDEALTRIYPPNGFGCRCEMIPELGLDDGEEATTLETAVGLLGTDWDKMIKKGFDKNRGQLGYVFDASEEYIKAFNPNAITYKSYALNAFEHLPNKEKLPIEHIGRSKSLDWFKEQIGKNDLTDNNRIRLTDYRSRPIELLKTLVTQIADERNGFLLQLLEKTISEPSEVWLTQSESGYHRNYLSFYDKKCVTVTVSFNNEKNEIIQALTLLDKENATIDDIRKGILIHHKK